LAPLLAGDEQAWTGLARQLRQELLGLTVRSVGEAAADDILQEVFIRVYTHRRELRDAAHLHYFVRQVWNQRVVDHWRRAGTRARGAEEIQAGGMAPPPPSGPDPAGQVLRDEFTGVIDRSALLAADQKLILKLHIFDGMALAEVAHLLGRDAASVQTRYYRALDLLRVDVALSAWRDGRRGLPGRFPEQARTALDLLAQGLSEKEVARRLGGRVPEARALLGPALKALCDEALAEWRNFFHSF